MREFYKGLEWGVGGGGAYRTAHFPRRSLHWATAAVGLITQPDCFQRLHDEEAGDSNRVLYI